MLDLKAESKSQMIRRDVVKTWAFYYAAHNYGTGECSNHIKLYNSNVVLDDYDDVAETICAFYFILHFTKTASTTATTTTMTTAN